MALRLVCDGGCGASTESPGDYTELGFVVKRHYCDLCKPYVEQYLEARDTLHTTLAQSWIDGMDKIRRHFQEKVPEGRLPDEG